MKRILIILSFVGLLLTIVPSVLVFMSVIDFEQHTLLMVAGMLAWFISAPFWMNKREETEQKS